MKRLSGVVIAATGIALLAYWELCWVRPAYRPLQGGNYGELYGPVSYFRVPVDIAFIILSIVGLSLALRRRHEPETEI